jgi:hypothetical protein
MHQGLQGLRGNLRIEVRSFISVGWDTQYSLGWNVNPESLLKQFNMAEFLYPQRRYSNR